MRSVSSPAVRNGMSPPTTQATPPAAAHLHTAPTVGRVADNRRSRTYARGVTKRAWVCPPLPLYGSDHERGDLRP